MNADDVNCPKYFLSLTTLRNLMIVILSSRSPVHDGGEDAGLLRIKLFAGHVPRVAWVNLLPKGGSLGHDLLDDVLAVHLHGGVVLLARHLGLANCGETVVLLSW